MKTTAPVLIILALCLTTSGAMPLPARAQAGPGTATSLQVTVAPRLGPQGREVAGWLILNARLTSADGKPLSNRQVDYYQLVELLGPREAYLGAATTDATGLASTLYQPAELGQQTINVYFAGGDGYAASTASGTAAVTSVVPPFDPEPLPLLQVRHWLPLGLGTLVLAAWLVLLGVLFRTVQVIRVEARRAGATRQGVTW